MYFIKSESLSLFSSVWDPQQRNERMNQFRFLLSLLSDLSWPLLDVEAKVTVDDLTLEVKVRCCFCSLKFSYYCELKEGKKHKLKTSRGIFFYLFFAISVLYCDGALRLVLIGFIFLIAWSVYLHCSVWIQKKATDVAPELKGTSIFLVGKHRSSVLRKFWFISNLYMIVFYVKGSIAP